MNRVNLAVIGCLIASCTFYACDNSSSAVLQEDVNENTVGQAAASSSPANLPAAEAAGTGALAKTDSNTATALPVLKPNPAKAALNPKHGEPGHRCDIPVGAPLDAKPATAPNIIQAAAPPVQQSASTAPNPKHGEPGHRCDIPVGAPLNSAPPKPTPAVSTSTPQVSTGSQPATTTLNSTASNLPRLPLRLPGVNATSAAAPADLKFNPKHGEPGHRCDLAVGAPLK